MPAYLPLPLPQRICTEILDDVLARALGIHFLEPIAIKQSAKKVVPEMRSIRNVNPNTGKFVQENPDRLTMAAEENRQKYNRTKKMSASRTLMPADSLVLQEDRRD